MELLHLENLTNNMVKFMELLFVVLTLYLTTCGGGDEDLPLPVTGRVGETVTLPCTLNLTDPIDRVTWMFHVNGKKILLAEFRDQKFIRENKNYFPNRLEGSNTGTALLIRKLRMEDSGIFTARFLVNGEEAEITYNVTVGLGGGDVPLPVTGRVGETVTLRPPLNLTDPIDRVTWMFHVNGEKIFLAEFRDQKFIRENENYFPNRLEGSNSGTALLIRELRMEDSGIFTALFLVNGKMRDTSYNLTVLEPLPIPIPVIKRVPGNTSDLCHLNCSVPSNSTNLSYSWICRDKGIDRLYANGSTITVSLKDEMLNAEFLCLVQNPAHRNNASVPFKSCDISGPGRGHLLPLIIAMSLLCVILVSIAVSKAVCCRIRQILKSTKTHEELHYSSIKMCSNGTNNQVNTQKLNGDCTNGDCTATSEKTTYAELLTNKLMNGEV
uniref:SLAM family member 6 n=1 Tax=Xenopus tropicalis TaxID=8364 RepID=A0A803JBP9_XENTR